MQSTECIMLSNMSKVTLKESERNFNTMWMSQDEMKFDGGSHQSSSAPLTIALLPD